MDFIPLPYGINSHQHIPDLGGPDYDYEGFLGYDLRQGWNLDQLRKGDVVGARLDWNEYSQLVLKDYAPETLPETGEGLINAVVAPFIQTWLFFGLFHEVLGRPVTREECSIPAVVATEQVSLVRPRSLSAAKLFTEFLSRKPQVKNDSAWAARVSRCLREAAWVLSDLDQVGCKLGGFIVPGDVHMALAVLVRALDDYSVIWCRPNIMPANAAIGKCSYLEQRLLDDKWCPNMVRRAGLDMGTEGLYYASLLPHFVDDQPHHGACSTHSCVAFNVESANYTVAHDAQFCDCKATECSHLEETCACIKPTFSVEKVRACLDAGTIPVVSLDKRVGGCRVDVTPLQPGMKYVAISHVWSDGRGNPKENSLPLCQVRAIHHYAMGALGQSDAAEEYQSSPIYFWIDTLCVPIVPMSTRIAAIQAMAQTYANATTVLVLSKELLAAAQPPTPDETLVRIFCSRWMSRLWTLHEGALAKDLVFQFQDSHIAYPDLDDAMIAAAEYPDWQSRLVGSRANTALTSVIAIRDASVTSWHDYPLCSLWTALRYRSTSKYWDAPICAGTLLGIDLLAILNAEPEDKMAAFWSSQPSLPASILFVNGPRMTRDTLRWAPSSLLDPRTIAVSLEHKSPPATRTPQGLLVSGLQGFWLDDCPLPTTEDAVIEFQPTPVDSHARTYYFAKEPNVENDSWNTLSSHWGHCALLLQGSLPSQTTFTRGALISVHDDNGPPNCSSTGTISPGDSDGKAKSIKDKDSEVSSARYLVLVTVYMKGSDYDHWIREKAGEFDNDEGLLRPSMAEVVVAPAVRRIGQEQRWCIW
jgi:hypothetical protein